MGTKARVLVACAIGGISLKPDNVIDLPEKLAKAHTKNGQVDTNKAAVDYCVNELGAKVIVYAPPPTAEQLQLQAEIAALEAQLAEAPEGTKASIQAELDTNKAALAELG